MKKIVLAAWVLTACAAAYAAPDIKAGEEKANTVCMACHGKGGISVNPEWPNLAGQGEKYIKKQLHDFKNGSRINPVMQPQAQILSDQDIDNVAAYFASQKPAPAATNGTGKNPEAILKLGEDLYRGGDMARGIPACMACHGPTGAGIEPAAFPLLSAQHAKYNRIQLQQFQNAANFENQATDTTIQPSDMRTNDPNQMMQDVAAKLTPLQIEAVTLYIQGLH